MCTDTRIYIAVLALCCIGFGMLKILRPQFFLDIRRRYPWLSFFDFYAFIYKSRHTRQIVVVNDYLLLAIGLGLLIWVAVQYIGCWVQT